MVVTSRRIPNPELPEDEKRKLLEQPKYKAEGISEKQPFMFLSLDLPAKPLFVDPHKQIAIPQVHIFRIYYDSLKMSHFLLIFQPRVLI